MAWTTPRTWTTGEAVTSALMNTHIRDQFQFMADEPHEAWLKRTADAAISNTTLTTITWQAEDRNVGGMWSSGTGHEVVPQEEGLYSITLNAQWDTGSGGSTYVAIFVNGSAIVGHGDDATVTNNWAQQRSVHATLECQAGDVITGRVFQNSGGTMNLRYSQGAGVSIKVVEVQRRHV